VLHSHQMLPSIVGEQVLKAPERAALLVPFQWKSRSRHFVAHTTPHTALWCDAMMVGYPSGSSLVLPAVQ
jgi:hypothetical protein